jgi:phage shock protein C
MVCSACGNEINSGARYCSACGRAVMGAGYAQAQTGIPLQTRLVRPRAGRVFGGVCASFALAYGWDVVVVRLVFCLVALFGGGMPILVYLIAWLIIPNETYAIPQAGAWTGAPPNSPPDSPDSRSATAA